MADNKYRTQDQRDESTATVDTQKSRKTNSFVFRLFILGIFTSLIWVFIGIFGESRAVPTTTSAAPQKPPTPLETCTRLITYIVRPGDSFLSILTRHGIPPEMAMTLHRTFKSLGLSALFPGDSCVMSLSSTGGLSGFSVLNRLQNWYHVSVDSGSINAHKAPAATLTQRCLVRGTLSTSLSEDLFNLGVGDACVSKFADIFAWDINFFVDPQPGDSFEIVFEKKYAEGRYMGYGDILAAKYVNNGHVFYAIGMPQDKGPLQYYDPDGKSLQKEFLKAPLRFNHISSRFSLRRLHPVLGIVRPHLGIDYAAPSGTSVFSAADGRILSAGVDGGYGNHIRVSHGGSYETSYGHLSAYASGIHAGVFVKQGDCIGYVGTTGMTTGPHLDYRMTRGGRFVNPLTVSLPRKGGVGAEELQAFYAAKGQYGALLSCRLPGMEGCYLLDLKTATNAAMASLPQPIGKTRASPAAGMPGS